jgi:hypothetical protein
MESMHSPEALGRVSNIENNAHIAHPASSFTTKQTAAVSVSLFCHLPRTLSLCPP